MTIAIENDETDILSKKRSYREEIQNRNMSPLQTLTHYAWVEDIRASKIEVRLTQLTNIAFTEFKSQRGEVLLI